MDLTFTDKWSLISPPSGPSLIAPQLLILDFTGWSLHSLCVGTWILKDHIASLCSASLHMQAWGPQKSPLCLLTPPVRSPFTSVYLVSRIRCNIINLKSEWSRAQSRLMGCFSFFPFLFVFDQSCSLKRGTVVKSAIKSKHRLGRH